MGKKVPTAKHLFTCESCEGEFTISEAYDRPGLRPRVCANCQTEQEIWALEIQLSRLVKEIEHLSGGGIEEETFFPLKRIA